MQRGLAERRFSLHESNECEPPQASRAMTGGRKLILKNGIICAGGEGCGFCAGPAVLGGRDAVPGKDGHRTIPSAAAPTNRYIISRVAGCPFTAPFLMPAR